MTPGSWSAARRVLAVRLDALGDVLMTTPAIRALKESAPGRHVTLLTSTAAAPLARLVPEVDEVIAHDVSWMKATAPRADAAVDRALVARLARGRFDAAAIFTVYSQSALPAALLCSLAGVPRRLAHCRENPYQLLTDWVPDPEPARLVRHEVRRQLDLVATVGARTGDERLSLRVPPTARARAAALLAGLRVEGDRWVLVHPGASAPSRRYPPERFAEVAERLAARTGRAVLFTGRADERALIDAIRAAMRTPAHSVAGRIDLAGMAALVAAAPLLISNNTGPVHVAAAVGTPVVDLYALTNPQHTPWGVPHRVLFHDVPCRYCYKSVCPETHQNCLRLVDPGAVVDAALELLAGGGRAGTAPVMPPAA